MGKEKQFLVKIGFDKPESSVFGGMSFANTTCQVGEEIKNKIVEEFTEQKNILTIVLANGLRHVNTRNILYIDVTEIEEQKEEKK